MLVFILMLLPNISPAQEKEETEIWDLFKFFVGEWMGRETGKSGIGHGERKYRHALGGKFLMVQNKSVFEPQESNPEGELHEDWGFISYDRIRKKIVYREFHVEEFVIQYILEDTEPGDKTLVFVSESIENIGPGWRARLTYEILSDNEFREVFELAAPGKEFEGLLENHLSRSQ